jgi:DNA polymerase III epsilon subunit family exonuclease
VAVDLETTGFAAHEGHDVIEIACVVIEDGALVSEWSTLVRPLRPVPLAARAVHGIDDAMLAAAPEPAAAAAALRARCGTLPLVFHQASFDLAFLRPLFRLAGLAPLDNMVIDTLGLARMLEGFEDHSLAALARVLGITGEAPHRALGDARTTARALLALAPRWERERGIRSLAELAATSQDALRPAARRAARLESSPGIVSFERLAEF